jgi:hypothetical protein
MPKAIVVFVAPLDLAVSVVRARHDFLPGSGSHPPTWPQRQLKLNDDYELHKALLLRLWTA